MQNLAKKDLVILASDRNVDFALSGIFSRFESLGIREVSKDIFVHPHHDPGCCQEGSTFLRPFQNNYDHALIVFDREGCGREDCTREEIEKSIEDELAISGWGDRARAIVIDPEVEMWVWSNSPHVENILGWDGQNPNLRDWLIVKQFLVEGQNKPARPKESLEAVLRKVKKPRSSSIYKQIAERVSLNNCVDPSFIKLKESVRLWFPLN